MKVRIDSDERYPCYSTRADHGHEVEATPEQVARWEAAKREYNAAQDEMGALYEAAEDAHRAEKARIKAEREAAEKAERKRVEQERRKAAARREAKRAKIREAGVVYDAEGNRLGVVREGSFGGLSIEVGDE